MNRRPAPFSCCMAAAVLWLFAIAAGWGAPVQRVTVDLSGLVFQDKLVQSANSLPAEVEPALAYTYSINATVHGTGVFSFFPAGTPLGVVLDVIQAGGAAALNATVPDLSGTLPLDLLHQFLSGSVSFLGTNIASASNLDLALNAAGAVTLSINQVTVDINGKESASDTFVLEAGSTLTVTAVQPPVAAIGVADAITTGSATLNGIVNPEGAATTVTFLSGTDATYGSSVTVQQVPAGLGPVAVSATLSNLSPATVYHYAVQAANLTGTTQSADATFETDAPPAPGSPSVTTGAATDITFTTATLGASVDPNGFDTTVVFEYGLDASYGFISSPVDSGSGSAAVPVTAPIQDLLSGQTYHFRAVASNTNGVIHGLDQTFQTTVGTPPTAFTSAASGVGLGAATVSALVNPNGADTSVSFEYGPTTSYGSALPSQDIGVAPGQVTVSATLSGLQPGTIYHYRADATNSAGLVKGADGIFATTSVAFGNYKGKYSGLFLSDPATFSTSGIFNLVINGSGSFTASGKLGGKAVSFSGLFHQNGAAIVNLPKSGITAHLQLAGSGMARTIAGTLSGSATDIVTAALAQTSATPAQYTVRLPHPADPALPQGNGYGSLKVAKTGAVKFSGKLGDGTSVTFSSALVSGSTFPIYALLYGKAGALVGNAIFETSTNGVLDAALAWFKPATKAKSGVAATPAFSTALALYGSAYKPPVRGQPVVAIPTGDFLFTSGTEGFDQSVALSTSNRLSPVLPNPQKLKASITTSTGLFTGSLLDPATGKSVPFSGALFQDTNLGTGLIQTKPQPGEVDLEPAP